MENDSSSAGSDSSSSSMESSDSQQISNAQQEVQDTTSCGNSDVGSYDQIKQNTADLEQQGTLPSLSLDDAQSQQSDNNSAMAQMEEYSGEDEDDDAVDTSSENTSAENAVNDGSINGSSAENTVNDGSNNGSSAENAVNDGSINGSSAEADAMQANDGSQIDNNQNSAMAQMEEYSGEDEDDDAVDTSSESKSGEGGGDEPAVEENGCENAGKQDRSFMENFRLSLAQNFAAAGIAASSMFTPSADLATNMSKQPEPAAQTQIVDSGLQVHGMNYDERAAKPTPSQEQKPVRECEAMDKTVADGRMVPSLTVKFAGLPESQSYGTLSAFPVDNNDKPDEQSFATTAHGFTKLPNQTEDKRYDTLDDGFNDIDSDKNGSASHEELKSKLNGSSESLNHQIQYVLDNYDKIAETSKALDPSAEGVTNEGLAHHYMENAQITVKTADGTSFPAHVESGNRNTDVAILKATDLTPDKKDSVGKNFEMAPKDASKGDLVTSYGHVRGIEQAEKLCHIPNQTSGLVTTDKEKGQLIPGDVQQAKLGTMAGMSGGPVVNANDNKVVGMNHAGWDESVNKFYVPASAIKEEMEKAKLKKH